MGSSTGSTTAPGLAGPLAGTGLTPRVAADRTDADLRIRKSASPLSTHIKSSSRADVAELTHTRGAISEWQVRKPQWFASSNRISFADSLTYLDDPEGSQEVGSHRGSHRTWGHPEAPLPDKAAIAAAIDQGAAPVPPFPRSSRIETSLPAGQDGREFSLAKPLNGRYTVLSFATSRFGHTACRSVAHRPFGGGRCP